MGSTGFIIGMRDAYFNALYEIFKQDKNAVFITADNGAPTLDKFASDFPDQYYQVGIAEQQMLGMAAGLAHEGRKVYTYAIAPFVTQRVMEFVKLDLAAMNLPIVNIGVGAGYSYDIMGPTHHTVEDISHMRVFPNMKIFSPCDATTAAALVKPLHEEKSPVYLRFDRAGVPNLYEGMSDGDIVNDNGYNVPIKPELGTEIVIVATGRMVHNAIEVANRLKGRQYYNVKVIDLFRLKPLSPNLLKEFANAQVVVTYEEHFLAGGMGSAILELMSDNEAYWPTLRIGQGDKFVYDLGGREEIWRIHGLDVDSVTNRIIEYVG